MAQVSMQQVKELRDRTQAGLNDCRGALMEAEGDMDKAVEIILKKGLAKSAKRAGAVATEGTVAVRLEQNAKAGVIVEVNIQTDFAARSEGFKSFVQKTLEAASSAKSGADLGGEPFPGGSGSVEEARAVLVGKLGENIVVRRWERLSIDGAGKVHSYIHMGDKIGVLLAVRAASDAVAGKPEFSKFVDDVAMQIAAMSPQHVSTSEVPEDAKKKQGEIIEAQMAEDPKPVPEKARPKIIEGKLAKWMKEVCLLEQASVLESDKSIEQLRAAVSKALGGEVTIARFVRYEVGEGIEKPTAPDFADEVAKMAGN
ncbi:MAG TPA: translation elongation factor Ts [Polyangiaceae bacterium]|nr:translation elongation factor Ts [Polyangiaceae bacterium]